MSQKPFGVCDAFFGGTSLELCCDLVHCCPISLFSHVGQEQSLHSWLPGAAPSPFAWC